MVVAAKHKIKKKLSQREFKIVPVKFTQLSFKFSVIPHSRKDLMPKLKAMLIWGKVKKSGVGPLLQKNNE